ncbi:MAG: GNAT family N-acetyltransferase [Croceitalea sp.]|nr:GNAT family N-acetyltransferase [Croceitalea sp.]NNM17930.1 GNAT family N-acetyltransferase [Croceitalea sp.]
MDIQFKLCTLSDLISLAQLAKSTFVEAFEKDNDPKDFQTYLKKAFSEQQVEQELKNENSFFYFAYLDHELVGYFKLNQSNAQTDVYADNTMELERIYVVPEHQNKKIGTILLNRAIAIAKEKQKQYIWLGVWQKNVRAIDFYEKHDFKKFDTHPYFIGSDVQTDWLMRKEL